MKIWPTLLTIAGSDSCGGAGIQADIKTACAFKVYASSVVTAVTAQNSFSVTDILPVGQEMVNAQLKAVTDDFIPDVIKIGMIPDYSTVMAISNFLDTLSDLNVKVVIDPVLVSTSGSSLAGDIHSTAEAMLSHLFPHAYVITPNLQEAAFFLGEDDVALSDSTAEKLRALFKCENIVLKGGHSSDREFSEDILLSESAIHFKSKRIVSHNTHGTGCAFSSALACGIAHGKPLEKAMADAKEFISRAIAGAVSCSIQKGNGSLSFF